MEVLPEAPLGNCVSLATSTQGRLLDSVLQFGSRLPLHRIRVLLIREEGRLNFSGE